MEEMKKKLFLSIKHFLQSRQRISLPPFSSASDPETPAPPPPPPPPATQTSHVPDPAHNHVEWPANVIGFCFSWAVAIAVQSAQSHESLHFLSHAMVVAVTLLYLSNYMFPKFPKLAQVLEHVGVLFGATAFFFAITIPFPLCIKLVYWTIFALSLLVILLIKYLH